MKKKHLLFLTLLLSQNTQVWGMYNGEEDQDYVLHQRPENEQVIDERRFQFELLENIVTRPNQPPSGRFRITHPARQETIENITLRTIQTLDFVSRLNPNLALDPNVQLVENCGHALKRIRCYFNYNGQNYHWEGIDNRHQYPLQGSWNYQENLDNHQTVAALLLKFRTEDGIMHDVDHEIPPRYIPYLLVDQGQEIPSGSRYDGRRVFRIIEREQTWVNTRTHERLQRTGTNFTPSIPGHEGNTVIFVQPFPHGNDAIPEDGYIGRYTRNRDTLTAEEQYPQTKEKFLIYSNGERIFFPRITQELWTRNNTFTRFLIASYNPSQTLSFINGIEIENYNHLPEGLYQLLSVNETPVSRLEKWTIVPRYGLRPEDHPEDIRTVISRTGLPSIPGMPNFILYPDPELPRNLIELHNSLNNLEILAHPLLRSNDPKLLLMGSVGSGKSALGNYIGVNAQVNTLNGRRIEENYIERFVLEHTNNRLPGFDVIHGFIGTQQPTAWRDAERELVLWDCPGFAGLETPIVNITHVEAIHQLINRRTPFKILFTVPEEHLTERTNLSAFVKSLDTLTTLFRNVDQLKDGCCLVITKQEKIKSPIILQGILAQCRQNNLLTPSSDNLLNFFATHLERVSFFPAPKVEGPYSPVLQGEEFNNNQQRTPRDKILASLRQANNITEEMQVATNPNSERFIRDLADTLNNGVTHFLKTTGTQKIINYCMKKISDHAGNVTTLRAELRDIANSFRNSSQETEETLANKLRNIIGDNFIRRNIDEIKFLRDTLNSGEECKKAEWIGQIRQITDKFDELAKDPTPIFLPDNNDPSSQEGRLKLTGTLIGTSDVERALSNRDIIPVNKKIHTINICASNTLIFDENVILNSGKVNAIAPFAKVIKNITIDLSGISGTAISPVTAALDQTGQHGNPGRNGGYFNGKIHNLKYLPILDINGRPITGTNNRPVMATLTVNTSGGRGGDGQNGGPGSNGQNGIDARGVELHDFNHSVGSNVAPLLTNSLTHKINRIEVHAGTYVDAIEIFHDQGNGSLYSKGKVGGSGGTKNVIIFAPNEKLIRIFGRSGEIMDCIGFQTTIKTYGPYGASLGGGAFSFADPDGYGEIVGIRATSRSFIKPEWVFLSRDFGVVFDRVNYSIPATDGHPGRNGGRGGRGGRGGFHGSASIEGHVFTPISDNGNPGRGGHGGPGGLGGIHGQSYKGYLGFQDRGSNPTSGSPGERGEPGASPSQPTEDLNRERLELLNEYRNFYLQRAADPLTSPFVKLFPMAIPNL